MGHLTDEEWLNVYHKTIDAVPQQDIEGIDDVIFYPYAGGLNYNDIIRITAEGRNRLLHLHKSYVRLQGKFLKADKTAKGDDIFVNNGPAMLFSEIRLSMNGTTIDEVKNPGRTGLMVNYPLLSTGELRDCWKAGLYGKLPDNKTNNWFVASDGRFTVDVPLRLLLGSCADHRAAIVNMKMELTLVRASADWDAITAVAVGAAATCVVELTKIAWHIPQLRVSTRLQLKYANIINSGKYLPMQFLRRELIEFPNLPTSPSNTIQVKTTSKMEKPYYIICGFQTDCNMSTKNESAWFPLMNLKNMQIYVDNVAFPTHPLNQNLNENNFAEAYMNFRNFETSYGGKLYPNGWLDPFTWKAFVNLYVFDVSTLPANLMNDGANIRVFYEKPDNMPTKTSLWILLMYRQAWRYDPLQQVVVRD